jgi:uncharacterized protein
VGVVILVVVKETSSDGRGYCRIETGQGAEGFITDAMSGSICRAATPRFQQGDYSGAIEEITNDVAARFATEFGVTLDGVDPRPTRARRVQPGSSSILTTLIIFFVILFVLSRISGRRRGCVGCLPIPIGGPPISGGWNSRRGGWSGGGFGGGFGGGGFGGGGFGGFGGGGGFSGGGGGSGW